MFTYLIQNFFCPTAMIKQIHIVSHILQILFHKYLFCHKISFIKNRRVFLQLISMNFSQTFWQTLHSEMNPIITFENIIKHSQISGLTVPRKILTSLKTVSNATNANAHSKSE